MSDVKNEGQRRTGRPRKDKNNHKVEDNNRMDNGKMERTLKKETRRTRQATCLVADRAGMRGPDEWAQKKKTQKKDLGGE